MIDDLYLTALIYVAATAGAGFVVALALMMIGAMLEMFADSIKTIFKK